VLDHPAAIHLPAVLAERGWRKAIVKPVLGASAHDATLVELGDCSAVAAAIDDGRLRRPLLLQPFIEEIKTRGEWSLVFIEGALTHAMVKRPGPGDFRVQQHHGGTSARAQAPPALERAGIMALEALPFAPLYARVDGVETGDGFLVMEVEVHEPGLFFPAALEAAHAFAEAILRRL